MMLREVTEKAEWDDFVLSQHQDSFLHSWNWGELHTLVGEKIVRFGIEENGELVGVAMGLTVTARRGSFVFCPHGPVVAENVESVTQELLDALKAHARRSGVRFLRVSPLDGVDAASFYRSYGFRNAPLHMHAETMWILDIRPSEDALLAAMRKTTRNLIRRASRDGVQVRVGNVTHADLEIFAKLYSETAGREGFVPFSKKFLAAEVEAFSKDQRMLAAIAERDGEPLAAALVPVYGHSGFYHQGASSRKHAKIPAPYLMHWEIIRALKARGCKQYNFWGIAPPDAPNHPWKGLTLFKQGFGGEIRQTLHAQDLPLSSLYWFTAAIERVRKHWRRY